MPIPPIPRKHLAAAAKGLRQLPAKRREMQAESSKLTREQMEQAYRDSLGWWYLYEMPVGQLVALLLEMLGQSKIIREQFASQPDPLGAVLDHFAELQDDDPQLEGICEQVMAKWSLGEYLSVLNALLLQIQARQTYGLWIGELLARGAAGSDEDLLHALSVDPTAIGCPQILNRMSIAMVRPGDRFIDLVASTISRARVKSRSRTKGRTQAAHDVLRYLLAAMHDVGFLADLSMKEADQLFIRELRVYTDRSQDPARSLYRFISRFKNR